MWVDGGLASKVGRSSPVFWVYGQGVGDFSFDPCKLSFSAGVGGLLGFKGGVLLAFNKALAGGAFPHRAAASGLPHCCSDFDAGKAARFGRVASL
jgi:hypothetical protein